MAALKRATEVAIVGAGPAGCTVALGLLERGVTPIIIEREEFPRFHIGESTTGECGAIIRRLGLEDEMNAAGHPIKHGVNVFGTQGKRDWWVPVMRRDEHGLHDQATWQVRRSEFDRMLLDAALRAGADMVKGRASEPIIDDTGVLTGVVVQTPDGGSVAIEAEMTIDCSGQASFLANKKVTGPKYLGSYDKQIAMFTHISDYQRGSGGPERSDQPGNTHIFYSRKYHWAWAIPIDDEVTSIGIVTPVAYFRDKGESREEYVRREMQQFNKGLAARIPQGVMVEPVRAVPNYSFQVGRFAGPGYICVGDAHRFVDPIFSFGLLVAMREAMMVIEPIMAWLDGEGRGGGNPFHDYVVMVEKGIDTIEDLVDTFWENPLAFAYLLHARYLAPITDVLAGRVYDDMPHDPLFDAALADFRRLLERERSYDAAGLLSVPIGSRFHPERAPLWNSNLQGIESTEEWLRTAM